MGGPPRHASVPTRRRAKLAKGAAAVMRPTVRYEALKTPAQLIFKALQRVRVRLVSQCNDVIL